MIRTVDSEITNDYINLLKIFKKKMVQADDANRNISPFYLQVTQDFIDVDSHHIEDIHSEIVAKIEKKITDVRSGKLSSQIILLQGAAGTGKSHLLRSFNRRSKSNQLGYIFIGGSAHWQIDEFDARLLDEVFKAVLAPADSSRMASETNLLQERIKDVAFCALGQMLLDNIALKKVFATLLSIILSPACFDTAYSKIIH